MGAEKQPDKEMTTPQEHPVADPGVSNPTPEAPKTAEGQALAAKQGAEKEGAAQGHEEAKKKIEAGTQESLDKIKEGFFEQAKGTLEQVGEGLSELFALLNKLMEQYGGPGETAKDALGEKSKVLPQGLKDASPQELAELRDQSVEVGNLQNREQLLALLWPPKGMPRDLCRIATPINQEGKSFHTDNDGMQSFGLFQFHGGLFQGLCQYSLNRDQELYTKLNKESPGLGEKIKRIASEGQKVRQITSVKKGKRSIPTKVVDKNNTLLTDQEGKILEKHIPLEYEYGFRANAGNEFFDEQGNLKVLNKMTKEFPEYKTLFDKMNTDRRWIALIIDKVNQKGLGGASRYIRASLQELQRSGESTNTSDVLGAFLRTSRKMHVWGEMGRAFYSFLTGTCKEGGIPKNIVQAANKFIDASSSPAGRAAILAQLNATSPMGIPEPTTVVGSPTNTPAESKDSKEHYKPTEVIALGDSQGGGIKPTFENAGLITGYRNGARIEALANYLQNPENIKMQKKETEQHLTTSKKEIQSVINALKNGAKKIYIMVGGNNASDKNCSLDNMTASAEKLIAAIRSYSPSIKIAWGGLIPPTEKTPFPEKRTAFNDWLRQQAAQGKIEYVETSTTLVDPSHNGKRNPQLSANAAHLNGKGYRKLAEDVMNKIGIERKSA